MPEETPIVAMRQSFFLRYLAVQADFLHTLTADLARHPLGEGFSDKDYAELCTNLRAVHVHHDALLNSLESLKA